MTLAHILRLFSNRGKVEGAFECDTGILGMVFARAVSGAKGLIYFPTSVAHGPFDKFLVKVGVKVNLSEILRVLRSRWTLAIIMYAFILRVCTNCDD